MSDCYNCSQVDRLESRISDLKRSIGRYRDEINSLKTKLYESEMQLDNANYRIREELEPRISSEKKSYDNWVLGGGSDPCMRAGLDGNCGYEYCGAFGSKEYCFECFENMGEEEVKELVDHGLCTDDIESLIQLDKNGCYNQPWLHKLFTKLKRKIESIIKKIEHKRCEKCWKEFLQYNGLMEEDK